MIVLLLLHIDFNPINVFVSSQLLAFLTDWFHSACGLAGDQTIDCIGKLVWIFILTHVIKGNSQIQM